MHPSRRRPRRGDRHLVRQGSRPRPRHRRAAAREPDGLAPQGRGAGPGRRRPRRQVLDPAVRVGRRARRPEHPVPVPGGQPGRARPRPSRDRAVPGIGTVDRAEDRHRGRGRIVNGQPGRGLAGPADPAGRRDARAHGPAAAPHAGPARARPGHQPAPHRAGVRAPQRAEPGRRARPGRRPRRGRRRAYVPRRAGRAAPPRHRRGQPGGQPGPPAAGRHAVAARGDHRPRVRRRPGGDPGRRGETLLPRGRHPRRALRRPGPAGRHRQARRRRF